MQRITLGDLTMAALMGFVATPITVFLAGAVLSRVASGHPVADAVIAFAGLVSLIAPVAILGAVPGLAVATLLRRAGLLGPVPVILAGAACASVAGLAELRMTPVFAGFGSLYAAICWIALRLLRADVFAGPVRGHEISASG